MKTDPGLLATSQRVAAFAILVIVLATVSGCASKSNVAKKAPYPSPYVVDIDEVMQREAVKARTRELVDSGQYKDRAAARSAAEKEYPPVVNQSAGLQEAEYYRWKQQQEVQTKFEGDLDKLKRKS